ncbi:hypothetical protein [Chryseobacterium sp. SC28]|nr:hypothetical protein [Chryseobacterium sp. SC28]
MEILFFGGGKAEEKKDCNGKREIAPNKKNQNGWLSGIEYFL